MAGEKRFYGPALLSTSPTTLFTGAANKRSVIELINVMNESLSSVDLTLSIGTDAATTRIYDGLAIRAKELRAIPAFFIVEEGEVLQGFCGTASAIVLTVSGRETSSTGGWGSNWGLNWGG